MKKITFRVDDIGASTKQFEQYGKRLFKYKNIPFFYFPLANFWFFKRIFPFKKWGKYNELNKENWLEFLDIFDKHKIIPIIAITACWVEKDSSFTPFPKKFPNEAEILKAAFSNGKIIIANHGLTHCVVGRHLPRFLFSNRDFHREFWPYLDQEIHNNHMLKSQEILENYFENDIQIFVPPGNVWSIKTYYALKKTNIKTVICNKYMADSNKKMEGVEFINDKNNFFCFHDRDLFLYRKEWLIEKINYYEEKYGN